MGRDSSAVASWGDRFPIVQIITPSNPSLSTDRFLGSIALFHPPVAMTALRRGATFDRSRRMSVMVPKSVKRLSFDPGRMLARVAPSRLAIAFSRAPGFAAIFKGGVCLPKPEIGATDIAAGFIQWSWRKLGAGMKLRAV
jgi:hypothetical protein